MDKGADVFTLSYHVLRYGVLTARGMAAGKRVCPVPCARTREKRIGKNNESLDHVMVGKRDSGKRVRLGQEVRRERIETTEG